MTNHKNGRYVLEWRISPVESLLATYKITGKSNPVYVQSSELPSGTLMQRKDFEAWFEHKVTYWGGRVSKPQSKGASWNIQFVQ